MEGQKDGQTGLILEDPSSWGWGSNSVLLSKYLYFCISPKSKNVKIHEIIIDITNNVNCDFVFL